MTCNKEMGKRLAALEAGNGPSEPLIIYRSIVSEGDDGNWHSRLAMGSGYGWQVDRAEDESVEDFEARCEALAREAAIGEASRKGGQ